MQESEKTSGLYQWPSNLVKQTDPNQAKEGGIDFIRPHFVVERRSGTLTKLPDFSQRPDTITYQMLCQKCQIVGNKYFASLGQYWIERLLTLTLTNTIAPHR